METTATRPYRVGDRVRVNDRCAIELHRSRLGTVADANPGHDTVHVLLDDDSSPQVSHWLENGRRAVYWSASLLCDSIDLVAAVEDVLGLTAFERQVLAEVEDDDGWERDGDGDGNWSPWRPSWIQPHSPAQSRALAKLAAQGLVLRRSNRPSAKLPDYYRKLAWDPRRAPEGE